MFVTWETRRQKRQERDREGSHLLFHCPWQPELGRCGTRIRGGCIKDIPMWVIGVNCFKHPGVSISRRLESRNGTQGPNPGMEPSPYMRHMGALTADWVLLYQPHWEGASHRTYTETEAQRPAQQRDCCASIANPVIAIYACSSSSASVGEQVHKAQVMVNFMLVNSYSRTQHIH